VADDAGLQRILVELAGTLDTDYDLDEVLERLLGDVARVLAVSGVCVVLVDGRGALHVASGTDEVVRRLAGREIELGQGPSVQACRTREPVSMVDVTAASPFPDVAARAVEAGLRAVTSFPLHRGSERIGALTVYRDSPGECDAAATETAQVLAAVITAYIVNAQQRVLLARTSRAAAGSAMTDPLTGLANRRLFLDRMAAAQATSRRHGSGRAVLFLDLDRFKLVNDGLGHQVGDRLLVQVAARLLHGLRPGDTVARLGGDEFAILCERLPAGREAEVAAGVAQRVLDELSFPVDLPDRQLVVTSSIGVAVAGPDDDPDTVLRHADAAMYRAKKHGKAGFEIFDQAMHAQAVLKLETEAALRVALDRDELVVHYQPVVDGSSGRLVSVEALLRWQHPQRGLLPAQEFLALAEETGLIIPMGAWVLDETCRDAARWNALRPPGQPAVQVSVNLSARELSFPGLVDAVAKAVTDHALDADALCLEITEGLLVADAQASVSTLHALKAFGVRIALDNFGTGHSSLAYLEQFPIDQLKVDRSFIGRLGESQNRKIVHAVIGLAHSLGLPVVAQGIESDAQLSVVRELDCDFVQGYLLGKPGGPAAIDALVAEFPPSTAAQPAAPGAGRRLPSPANPDRPGRIRRFGPGGAALAAVAVLGIVVLLLATGLAVRASRAAATVDRQAATWQQLMSDNEQVLVSLLDAETGQRGYLLTGQESYLSPYDDAVARLPPVLDRLDRLAAALPQQQAAIARIRQLSVRKTDELAETLRLRSTGGPAAALTLVDSDRGKQVMDELRSVQAGITGQVGEQLDSQRTEVARRRGQFQQVGATGVVLLLGLLVGMLWLLGGRGRAERERLQAERDRRRLTEQLTVQAVHDPLTGLPSRRLLEDRITNALLRADVDSSLIAVFLVDVNQFQLVNDGHGRAGGDAVLLSVARRLLGHVRATDTVARVGGDQFVVLGEGFRDPGEAERAAEALAQRASHNASYDGTNIPVTASVGVVAASARSLHGETPPAAVTAELLLSAVDSALRAAKQGGPARWHGYDAQVARRHSDASWVPSDLRAGLADNQLWVAYQPLVDLDGGQPIGVEALARWRHPERGPIGPDVFIPVAEQTGLIHELGAFVLGESARHVSGWNRDRLRLGLPALRLSVNCSVRQLLDDGFATAVARALAESGLPAHLLTVEITESVLVDAVAGATDQITGLAELGLTMALDDFGTGYSSLGYLHRFPIGLIKIDRSFVAGLGHSLADEAIVRSVVGLAAALGQKVLAEGIETAEQARHARRLGCHYAQGYYFGRPADAASVGALLLPPRVAA